MGTRAVTFGTARLFFCRVNANFLARVVKKSGGPGPAPEASLNTGLRAEKRFCGANDHR